MKLDDEDINKNDAIAVVDHSAALAERKMQLEFQAEWAEKHQRTARRFLNLAISLAARDQATAEKCFYSVPRWDSKKRETVFIEGPSIRLAEIVASAWGNLEYGSALVDVGESAVLVNGWCHDLETGVRVNGQVYRPIVTAKGKRFGPSGIADAIHAAQSIAKRNAIFQAVPRGLLGSVIRSSKNASLGKGTLEQRRYAALEYFTRSGIDKERVLSMLGRPSVDDVDNDDIIKLRGLATAIREGETTLEDAFREPEIQQEAIAAPPPAPEPQRPSDPEWERSKQVQELTKSFTGLWEKYKKEHDGDVTMEAIKEHGKQSGDDALVVLESMIDKVQELIQDEKVKAT